MEKENINVKCPNCGDSCKASEMTSVMNSRLKQCQGCKCRIGTDEDALDAAAQEGQAEVLGVLAPTGTERNKQHYAAAREKATQAQPASGASGKHTAPPAASAEATKPAGTSENRSPASRQPGSNSDADALVRDAQRRAAGTTNQADALSENPLLADAKRKAADAGKQDDKESRDPLLADARKRAEA